MNPEQLHDALSQLPDDLIAEVDALRRPAKKGIPWKRLVPVAACFALVLTLLTVALPLLTGKDAVMESQYSNIGAPMAQESAGEPEAPMESAPAVAGGAPLLPDAEDNAEVTTVQTIPVTATAFYYGSTEPEGIQTEIICSLSELEESHLITEEISVEVYDEAWFRENQLILFLADAASSSVRYDIRSLRKTGPGCWELTGSRIVPQEFTDDLVQQLLLVELPRTVEPEDVVILNLKLVKE